MKDLLTGDIVIVCKLDCLARSSRDLHNILHELGALGCGFTSLGETWCDTTTDVGRLMLTIMGGIGEFERGLIRKRCEEGIERAKRKGVTFGRKRRDDQGCCRALYQGRDDGGACQGLWPSRRSGGRSTALSLHQHTSRRAPVFASNPSETNRYPPLVSPLSN